MSSQEDTTRNQIAHLEPASLSDQANTSGQPSTEIEPPCEPSKVETATEHGLPAELPSQETIDWDEWLAPEAEPFCSLSPAR